MKLRVLETFLSVRIRSLNAFSRSNDRFVQNYTYMSLAQWQYGDLRGCTDFKTGRCGSEKRISGAQPACP